MSSRKEKQGHLRRGYFGIGIENPGLETNLGTLFRTALIFGADFVFTVGSKYQEQHSDTMKSCRHMPCFRYFDYKDFIEHLPKGVSLIGVEQEPDAKPIRNFVHPERAMYILGNERQGLTKDMAAACDYKVVIPGDLSINVAVAGSIVLYDRINKAKEIL